MRAATRGPGSFAFDMSVTVFAAPAQAAVRVIVLSIHAGDSVTHPGRDYPYRTVSIRGAASDDANLSSAAITGSACTS